MRQVAFVMIVLTSIGVYLNTASADLSSCPDAIPEEMLLFDGSKATKDQMLKLNSEWRELATVLASLPGCADFNKKLSDIINNEVREFNKAKGGDARPGDPSPISLAKYVASMD